eukprot:m.38925 g.38925  ORF g.38925 m.38925 type:complete len:183 (+) comp11712_c0_seq1:74-622(+)
MSSPSETSYATVALNAVLGCTVGYLLYKLFAPAPQVTPKVILKRKEIPMRDFTLETLKAYDGLTPHAEHDGAMPVYLAVNFTVFDVSAGRGFYGPGGPYACFAGRDASRGLATMSFSVSDEWDDLTTLSKSERSTMMEWHDKFSMKYHVRGKLVKELPPAGAAAATDASAAAPAAAETAPSS